MKILKGRKLNKKGMTLIEVIVAMAILAIVITPVLRIFASTSGTNLRSRRRQRATVVAEATMESFKAYTVEQLCRQFMSGGFKGVDNMISTDAGHPTSMSVVGVYPGGESSPFHRNQTLNRYASQYKFRINNVASESVFYDVDVFVTPNSAHTLDMVNFDDINEYSDAIISLKEEMNYDALAEFETTAKTKFETYFTSAHATATSKSIDDIEYSDFKRLIEIEANDNGTSQKVVVKVTYTCKAKVKYKYMSGPVGSATSTTGSVTFDESVMKIETKLPDDSSTDTEWTVYDNSATIAGQDVNGKRCKLNNIYLYYFPAYPGVFGSGAEDEIKISGSLTNLYNEPDTYSIACRTGSCNAAPVGSCPTGDGYEALNVVIAKQLSTKMTDIELNSGEMGYKLSVDSSFSGGGKVELYSNLRDNFCPLGSVSALPTIAGFNADKGIKEHVVDRYVTKYDVEIHVYDAGTTDEVSHFEGSINE